MFTGIIAAVGEVRACKAIGEGRDMRLVIGTPGRAAGAAGAMRAGGLVFLPSVTSGLGVVEGAQDCVRALRAMLEAEGLGLEALVRLGVAVAEAAGGDEAGMTRLRMGELARAALAAALPAGGPVPAVVFVAGLPGGARVQAEAVARAQAGAGGFLAGVEVGASIACSGCCLTVVGFGADWFAVEASAETLSLTTLGRWAAGTKVNLERALRLGDELGGHMVSGHVDGLGEMVARTPENGSLRLEFALPRALARFVATKGSIAVDGVSLTVNSVRDLEGDFGRDLEAGSGRGPGHGLGGDAGRGPGGDPQGDAGRWAEGDARRGPGGDAGAAGVGVAAGGAVFGVNVIPHTAQATTLGLRRPGEAVHIEVDGAARNAARLADPAWSDRQWADRRWTDRQAWDGSGDAARTGA